jgi:hypothetical protein
VKHHDDDQVNWLQECSEVGLNFPRIDSVGGGHGCKVGVHVQRHTSIGRRFGISGNGMGNTMSTVSTKGVYRVALAISGLVFLRLFVL